MLAFAVPKNNIYMSAWFPRYYYYLSCHPTMWSMIFNMDHSQLSRKKKNSETKGNPYTKSSPGIIVSQVLKPSGYRSAYGSMPYQRLKNPAVQRGGNYYPGLRYWSIFYPCSSVGNTFAHTTWCIHIAHTPCTSHAYTACWLMSGELARTIIPLYSGGYRRGSTKKTDITGNIVKIEATL